MRYNYHSTKKGGLYFFMPNYNDDDVDYGEYRYKNYLWRENGRFVKPQKQTVATAIKKQTSRSQKDKVGAFAIFSVIICFAITFLLADFFSGSGFLAFTGARAPNKKGNASTYYALSLDYYETESIASMTADELRQMGGGGYAIKDNGFYLISSVYGSEDEASTVLKRLNSKNASIYKIIIKELPLQWYKGDKKSELLDTLKYAEITFDELYAISIALDNAELTEYTARAEITVLTNKIKLLKAKFDDLTTKDRNISVTKIKVEMVATIAMLENLLSYNVSRPNLISDIRYTYTAVLVAKKNLSNNM